jgi:hypothetical protein
VTPRRSAVAALAALAALAVVSLPAAPAAARSTRELSYPRDKLWPTAVRFLRVDEKLKIVEKDEDAGYLLFELIDGKRTFQGALELVATTDDRKRPATRLIMRLTDRPAYMEEGLLDRFEQKVRDELGEPPAPPPEPPPEPPKDEGAPADKPK